MRTLFALRARTRNLVGSVTNATSGLLAETAVPKPSKPLSSARPVGGSPGPKPHKFMEQPAPQPRGLVEQQVKGHGSNRKQVNAQAVQTQYSKRELKMLEEFARKKPKKQNANVSKRKLELFRQKLEKKAQKAAKNAERLARRKQRRAEKVKSKMEKQRLREERFNALPPHIQRAVQRKRDRLAAWQAALKAKKMKYRQG